MKGLFKPFLDTRQGNNSRALANSCERLKRGGELVVGPVAVVAHRR
jgi:hypothetical protein